MLSFFTVLVRLLHISDLLTIGSFSIIAIAAHQNVDGFWFAYFGEHISPRNWCWNFAWRDAHQHCMSESVCLCVNCEHSPSTAPKRYFPWMLWYEGIFVTSRFYCRNIRSYWFIDESISFENQRRCRERRRNEKQNWTEKKSNFNELDIPLYGVFFSEYIFRINSHRHHFFIAPRPEWCGSCVSVGESVRVRLLRDCMCLSKCVLVARRVYSISCFGRVVCTYLKKSCCCFLLFLCLNFHFVVCEPSKKIVNKIGTKDSAHVCVCVCVCIPKRMHNFSICLHTNDI